VPWPDHRAAAGSGGGVSIEIANESGAEVDEAALAGLARHVLDGMGVHPLAELSVLLVDEPAMAELHVRWMGESGPTDVLAFPMDELWPPQPGGVRGEHAAAGEPAGPPGLLGDVVICPQVASEQARKAAHAVAEEIELLCTHGILHLLGYDHGDPDEHARMFGLQDALLAGWRSERDHITGPGSAAAGSGGSPEAGDSPAADQDGDSDSAGDDRAGESPADDHDGGAAAGTWPVPGAPDRPDGQG
jgi:probable rRNA maturation factor